jgi:hypothetical protein
VNDSCAANPDYSFAKNEQRRLRESIRKKRKIIMELLNKKFNEIRRRNPKFSLRAFARLLSADPGEISKILRGKKAPSSNICLSAVTKLQLNKEEKAELIEAVIQARSHTLRKQLESILVSVP